MSERGRRVKPLELKLCLEDKAKPFLKPFDLKEKDLSHLLVFDTIVTTLGAVLAFITVPFGLA